MDNLRSKVAKKTAQFMRVAQQAPAPPPPPADAAPAPGAPMPPRAPARPPAAPPAAPGAPAPAAPAAPAPTPRDMAEQNVQKQVEKDKMQEVKLDKVEQALTQSTEKIDSLVDAVVDMKQVIEKTVLGEPGMDDKLKMLKEKEKDRNKLTAPEFGLDDTDKSIVSKEERNMATEASALRQARKERLEAGDLKYHSDKYNPEGLKFEDVEHENKKYKQQVPAPEITKVKKDETPELFRIALDLSDDESKWSVVDKTTEQALYEIKKTETNAENFSTEAFARAVIADMKALGIAAAMAKHGALPLDLGKPDAGKPPMGSGKPEDKPGLKEDIKDKTKDLGDAMKPKGPGLGPKGPDKGDKGPLELIKKTLPLPKGDDLKKEDALPLSLASTEKDIQRRFLRAFRVALSAQQKNLIDNPLKAAWYRALTAMNIDEPTRLIEATFSQAALDQFEVALKKAEEYLALSDEAFVETESTVGEFKTVAPEAEGNAPESAVKQSAAAMRERAKKASMVVSTASEADAADRASMIAQALPIPKLAGISRFAKR